MARCKRCARRVAAKIKRCPQCGVDKPVEYTWTQIAAVWLAVAGLLVVVTAGDQVDSSGPLDIALGYLAAKGP